MESRYHHLTSLQFQQILSTRTITERKQLATQYGLCIKPPILDNLIRDRHMQSPQDVYHACAGKISRLLKNTIDLLSTEGKDEFLKYWKEFEKPKNWCRLPNPVAHHESFMMSDYLHITMIIPFILKRFLKPCHLNSEGITNIQRRLNINRSDLVPKALLKCWVITAKTTRLCFSKSFTDSDYTSLESILKEECDILTKVFGNFVNLPNLHVNMHLLMHARNFATLLNTAVGTKEMVHRIFKKIVPSTNKKIIELDLLKRYTTLFALRHLLDGGIDFRSRMSDNSFVNIPRHLRKLFDNWFITEDAYNYEDEDDIRVYSQVDDFFNIKLSKKLASNNKTPANIESNRFWAEFAISYSENNRRAALINHTIQYYERASYSCKDDFEIIKSYLHLGDAVTIQEEDYNESYALIRSIFCHKSNDDKDFAFIVVDWFEDTNQIHETLECPLFRLQTNNRQRWHHVFPITVIDSVGKEHFVDRCSVKQHDLDNNLYFKNAFLFMAV